MPILTILIRRLMSAVVHVRPWVLLSALGTYLGITWTLLVLANETSLVESFITFLYFTATVASTIGFGDYSPKTDAGKLIAVLWLFPCSLLIYSMLLAKLSAAMFQRLHNVMTGLGDYTYLKDAAIIIGYQEGRTRRMIAELVAGRDGDHNIVLVSKQERIRIPDDVRFVRTDRLDDVESLRRAGVANAAKILVHAETDAETFNACLAVREITQQTHVAAYFHDHDTARRAERLANVEAVVSNSAEMLVRAAQDPGAGKVLLALASAGIDSAVYADTVSEADVDTTKVITAMCERNATVIAIKGDAEGDPFRFRPFPDILRPGATVYYIAETRLGPVWDEIQSSVCL